MATQRISRRELRRALRPLKGEERKVKRAKPANGITYISRKWTRELREMRRRAARTQVW